MLCGTGAGVERVTLDPLPAPRGASVFDVLSYWGLQDFVRALLRP